MAAFHLTSACFSQSSLHITTDVLLKSRPIKTRMGVNPPDRSSAVGLGSVRACFPPFPLWALPPPGAGGPLGPRCNSRCPVPSTASAVPRHSNHATRPQRASCTPFMVLWHSTTWGEGLWLSAQATGSAPGTRKGRVPGKGEVGVSPFRLCSSFSGCAMDEGVIFSMTSGDCTLSLPSYNRTALDAGCARTGAELHFNKGVALTQLSCFGCTALPSVLWLLHLLAPVCVDACGNRRLAQSKWAARQAYLCLYWE